MLRIRLSQRGKKHQRSYRVVVMEASAKRDGRFVEDLGFYHPKTGEIKIDRQRLEYWLTRGAQLSQAVRRLL